MKLEQFEKENRQSNGDPYGKGRLALIMGGGTCLIKDLSQQPQGANIIKIGINHHVNILFPHFIVSEDIEMNPLFEDLEHTKVFGRHKLAQIITDICPDWNNSGINAVWIADYLGFDQIVLAGFDCWNNDLRWHWHDRQFSRAPFREPQFPKVLDAWQEMKDHLKNPSKVFAISEELKKIFKAWKN